MAKTIDLDALRRPPLKASLAGTEHVLAAPTLDVIGKIGDLSKNAVANTDGLAQRKGLFDMLALIAPSLGAEAIASLEDGQATALIDFWNRNATEETKADERDAKDILADPTPPG